MASLLWSIRDDCLKSDLFSHQPQPVLSPEAKEMILKCIINFPLVLQNALIPSSSPHYLALQEGLSTYANHPAIL